MALDSSCKQLPALLHTFCQEASAILQPFEMKEHIVHSAILQPPLLKHISQADCLQFIRQSVKAPGFPWQHFFFLQNVLCQDRKAHLRAYSCSQLTWPLTLPPASDTGPQRGQGTYPRSYGRPGIEGNFCLPVRCSFAYEISFTVPSNSSPPNSREASNHSEE